VVLSFLDDVRAETRKPVYLLAEKLRGLDPKLRAEVVEAIADPSLPSGAIARALAKRGVDVKEGLIQKHRREKRAWPDDLL